MKYSRFIPDTNYEKYIPAITESADGPRIGAVVTSVICALVVFIVGLDVMTFKTSIFFAINSISARLRH